MKIYVLFLLGFAFFATSCSRKSELVTGLRPTAFGAAIVESSGGKQFGRQEACCLNP